MVKPKKFLGQHFLRDLNTAAKIVDAFRPGSSKVVEIGPGTGVLTKLLVEKNFKPLLFEIDDESVAWLQDHFTMDQVDVRHVDFLEAGFEDLPDPTISVIGNLPYNISSQIFFKILESRNRVNHVVCMIQKEVAQRIAAPPGGRTCGILSILIQAFYEVEMLFHVSPGAFHPPPKVMSSVIRLTRNQTSRLSCDEDLFFKVVKRSFQNRRKTLRNALKDLNLSPTVYSLSIMDKRAEQLSVSDFVQLIQQIERS